MNDNHNPQFKPIETIHSGYRFRSRLEARWAVFFEHLGIPYEYEKEGYNLGGLRYLPDFWLPKQDCWIEIKGKDPTREEEEKANILAQLTQFPVYIFFGNIERPQEDAEDELAGARAFYPTPDSWILQGADPLSPCHGISPEESSKCGAIKGCNWGKCPHEIAIPLPKHIADIWQAIEREGNFDICDLTIVNGRVAYQDHKKWNQIEDEPVFRALSSPLDTYEPELRELISSNPGWVYGISNNAMPTHTVASWEGHRWYECPKCHFLDIQAFPTVMECECHDTKPSFNSSRLIAAYTAARQARFSGRE